MSKPIEFLGGRNRALISQLVHFRERSGLTQAKLAKMLNRTQSWVAKFEKKTDAGLHWVDAVGYAAALGIQLSISLVPMQNKSQVA